MDNPEEGYLLIGTTMIILIVIAIAFFFVMLIYRRRKIEHLREVEIMKEKYHKEMLETQIEIQQDTMQQIGREIHDNVGQKLTLAALYTTHLNLQQNPAIPAEKISGITDLINESLNDLRELSQYLTTHHPEGGATLENLLQKEVVKVKQAQVCSVHFETSGESFECSLKVKNMVMRIAQEFLHNSIRHSSCKNIYVHIRYNTDGVNMSLSDDGKGFIPAEIISGPGIGLNNMKSRASLIGAELSLKSQPGKGTYLDLFIPAKNIT